jgi:hypothetical protein
MPHTYSVPITVPPGLRLHGDLPLPMGHGVLALPHHVDIVHLSVGRALLLSTLICLVRHRPTVAVSIPHPGPSTLHHRHPAAGVVHLLIPLLGIVATGVERTAVAPRLDDDVYPTAQVGPFHSRIALDRLPRAKLDGGGVL